MGELRHLPRGHSQKGVEDLLAIGSVEPFDKDVLRGLARLDVEPCKPVPVGPGDKDWGRQFRAVVEAERLGRSVVRQQLVLYAAHPWRRDRGVDLDGHLLAITFLERVQRAAGTSRGA